MKYIPEFKRNEKLFNRLLNDRFEFMNRVDDITGSNHDNYSQSGLANLLFVVWSLMTYGYRFFCSVCLF